jgi:hypothetical protein
MPDRPRDRSEGLQAEQARLEHPRNKTLGLDVAFVDTSP